MKPRADTASSIGPAPTTPAAPVLAPAQGAAGVILGGKYSLVREIGRGGMGVVWLAERLGWNAPVAVKMLALADTPLARERFEREVRLAATLRSPHVVQVLDHGVDEQTGSRYLVMELLDGESLAQRQQRLGTLSPAEVLSIVAQLERVLTKAHALGIGHRDLKPDNIFLVPNGNEVIVKVLDFGVAKSFELDPLDSQAVTVEGNTVGTPWYMSPEQLRGASTDPRGDLWSLAVIVCECLTGRRPFQASDLAVLTLVVWSEHRPVPSSLGAVPPGFDAWFARATEREIERRFSSAAELLEALRPICEGASEERPSLASTSHSLPAPSVAPVSNTGEPQLSRRPKGMLGLLAGTAIGLGAAASAYFWVRPAPLAAPPAPGVAMSPLQPAAAPPRSESFGARASAQAQVTVPPDDTSRTPQPLPLLHEPAAASMKAPGTRAAPEARPAPARKQRAKRRPSKTKTKPAAPTAPSGPRELTLEVPTRQEL
jgi:serine/threonine protein kinase